MPHGRSAARARAGTILPMTAVSARYHHPRERAASASPGCSCLWRSEGRDDRYGPSPGEVGARLAQHFSIAMRRGQRRKPRGDLSSTKLQSPLEEVTVAGKVLTEAGSGTDIECR